MSNYKRPVIIWGNSFYINIELKQFNKDTSEYEYFDLTKCHDVKVNLICATHNTVIPLEWNLLDGYNYIMRCFVDYRLLHNTSYGIEVEGLNENDIHWRWYMLPKEGLLVVNNSSGLNIPDEVTTVDLAGRVGWGIQTDGDLTNYYTKTEVNNLIDESTDNSPYVLECWQEIDEDLRTTLTDYILNSRDIILHESDGGELSLFEYTLDRYNKVSSMVWHNNFGEDGSAEITQYYWRNSETYNESNGWSVSDIDFMTSEDKDKIEWDGVAINTGTDEDPVYTYKIVGKKTWKNVVDIIESGKTIQLAIHPESQTSKQAGYPGVPDYSVTLLIALSSKYWITYYFYCVGYNYFEWEDFKRNEVQIITLRIDPDKSEYPDDESKWGIKLTEQHTDVIKMAKDVEETTEQVDNIELQPEENKLVLKTTLDASPKVFSRVGMKTINNQTLFGEGNIDIQGGGEEQVQSDWNETDTTSPAYIQNKPDINELQTAVDNLDTEKQDVLESGVNIKTVNGESILGEGNITIESGVDVEPAKIVVTDEEVADPDPDAVYIVQKPIELKTINGEEIVGTGNIEISGGEQSDWNETDTTSPAYIQNKPDITSIEGSISDVQNDIDNLEDDIAAQQAEISGVQTAISGHQTAIQNQATEISGMQTQISGHQTAIQNQATEISGIQTVVAGHQSAIQNQATEISGMQSNISGMQTAISGHQTAIQNQATEISGMQTVLAGHQTALENQSGGGDPGFIKVGNGLVNVQSVNYNTNVGDYAIIENGYGFGYDKMDASGSCSHAEGTATKATGVGSHAEGDTTRASNFYSHAEGSHTVSSGHSTHAEGQYTTASKPAAHAEGYYTVASNTAAHAEGYYTQATNQGEHASGQYNVSTQTNTTFGDAGNTLFSVGNGTDSSARHNAFEIRQNGDIYLNDGSHPISSTTNGLKIEVVSALPATPDANTIYIIQ